MSAEVLDELLRRAERDPLPGADTSSHWREHGARTVARRDGATVVLTASGFQTLHRLGPAGRILSRIERLTYRSVTARYRSFPRVWRDATDLARRLGGDPDYYVLRVACAIALLRDHFELHGLRPTSAILIGDGAGLFGAVLRRSVPGISIWSIDLPKQLVFQARTHADADPRCPMAVGRPAPGGVAFVVPSEAHAIPAPVDLAVTIAAMQEMAPEVVARYFALLRERSGPASRFYCVSRAEKILPGGEVSRFDGYPWSSRDDVFIDGPCPYYTHFLSRHTGARGPRLFGVRVPFMNHFDGIHLHRLARLASEEG